MLSAGDPIDVALWEPCRCEEHVRVRRAAYLCAEWPTMAGMPREHIPEEALDDAEAMIEETFGEESRGLND